MVLASNYLSALEIFKLQSRPNRVRNVCIMAHVDHGKTTLADALIAANGIISERMAGKLRYLDSRPDEQARGITMKSSSISLFHLWKNEPYLVNLVDSPGHTDFCGEVSAAAVLCDGVVLVVDVVEGVCPQTNYSMRLAWKEGLRPCLVLNKIDRLFTEMHMTAQEAYARLVQVLEQANAVAGELLMCDVLNGQEEERSNDAVGAKETHHFLPPQGNVLFASALDGWAFCLRDFSQFWSCRLGIDDELSLRNALWGDYYYDARAKEIKSGASNKGKDALFVSMILQNVAAVYEALLVHPDVAKAERILKFVNCDTGTREYARSDQRQRLQLAMNKWAPLANAALAMICEHLPAADQFCERRAEKIMAAQRGGVFRSLSEPAKRLKESIVRCDGEPRAPVVAFVSKMIPVEKSALTKYHHYDRGVANALSLPEAESKCRELRRRMKQVRFVDQVAAGRTLSELHCFDADESPAPAQEYVFLGFARVLSGRLSDDQTLYLVLDGNESPLERVTIDGLYIMMGREYVRVDSAPSGNIVCVGGLQEHVTRSGTLSTCAECPPLCSVQVNARPIVRVSIEPKSAGDLPALLNGLKLLRLADPSVEAFVEETGEYVLVTVGEMHLQRCLEDLRCRFAVGVDLRISEPIVPFAETIVTPPRAELTGESPDAADPSCSVAVWTSNKRAEFKLTAVPLPSGVLELLEGKEKLLRLIDPATNRLAVDHHHHVAPARVEKILQGFQELKEQLGRALVDQGSIWPGLADKIWAFGAKKAPLNLLINSIATYDRPSVFDALLGDQVHLLRRYDQSVVTGFWLRCRSGPMCEEPMRGVALFVQDWKEHYDVDDDDDDDDVERVKGDQEGAQDQSLIITSGQIVVAIREGFRLAFEAQQQRLVLPMYNCVVQATGDVLGKVYAVLNRRGGKIINEEMKEGTNLFEINASLSVVESFGFADELRKRANGLAWPQLVFSHWEVIACNPFSTPPANVVDEALDDHESGDNENVAKKYINAIRKRKGLALKEKIVIHAEKQRTLAKKV